MRENLMYGLTRVQWRQGDGLLEGDTLSKGEKQSQLTRPGHHCAIVLLYNIFIVLSKDMPVPSDICFSLTDVNGVVHPRLTSP